MPVEQAPLRKATQPRNDATVVRYHDYIDEKIESTRRAVKVVDLATALVELAVSVLLFLLLAVVIEHWFVAGGFPFFVRATLFTLLIAGAGYFAYRRLWPLCIRAINPVYAAQTIEHSTPTLKNGLINLLLFRQHRQEIPDAVYRTIEEQAAHGLTRAPVDTAVDRTELIRLGYVLLAIVAVAALYKVFSPKDPFVAVERVLMPWADIVPASRVTISEVTPGSVTISRGEYLDVAAEVHGLSDDDTVVLRYTTEDGQVVDRTIPLKRSSDGLQFTGRLADDSQTNNASAGAGIARNLKYRLEAGDARTRNYTVQVVPAASILVERIDYHYPPYTGFVDNSVDGVGDIRAIEGTRVTVHARANGQIREANVDFDADGRPDLKMNSTEVQAQAAFDLTLRDDRQTPTHASYVLRFTNDEGRVNRSPVKHSINVEPDLPPEAEIRQPQDKLRDVRLDEQVTIEVEARDPDFALQAVRLRGQVMGSDAVNELLLKSEQRGRFNGRFMLLPSAHNLKADDVLEYWAEADDNRTPKPNTVASEHKTLRIVSPNPAQQPPPDQVAKNDRQPQNQQPQQGDQQRGGDQQPGKQQPKNGSQQQEQQGGEAGKQQQGDKNANGQQGKDSQGQQDKGDNNASADSASNNQAGGDQKQGGQDQKSQDNLNKDQKESGQRQNGGQGKDGQKQTDGKSAAGDSATNPADKSQGQEGQQDKQTGAGAAGGESSKDGTQPRGARPDDKQNQPGTDNYQSEGQQQSGSRQADSQKPQASEKESPVSSQGDNDAEAFERIQKRLEKTGDLKREDGGKDRETRRQGNKATEKKEQAGKSTEKQENKETEGQIEQKSGESASADGERKKSAEEKTSQEAKGEQKTNERGEGKGADAQSDNSKQQDGAKSEQRNEQKSLGGEQTSSKGSPGGGDEQKNQGSPNTQQGMKPTEKPNQAESKGEKPSQQEPPAGANSKRESDSHGDQGGDKAGGGEEGGGQKSPHDGTGSAGANQSADKGAGQSGEKGKGENSSEAGKDAKSQDRTGAGNGKTAGKGSEQRQGTGDQPGGGAGDHKDNPLSRDAKQSAKEEPRGEENKAKTGESDRQGDKETGRQGDRETARQGEKTEEQKPGETASADGKATEKKTDAPHVPSKMKEQQNGEAKSQKGPAGPSENFGQPNGAMNPQPSITGEAPKGDDANLEYARKQTDLVLDKLADQMKKKRVDEGLLKDLGWSETELKKFIERWQQRKAAAEKNDEAGETARRELDDALRSLGLRRGELEQNAVQRDTMRDLREGYRGPVPTEYKDRLRAYNQGVSRARQNSE